MRSAEKLVGNSGLNMSDGLCLPAPENFRSTHRPTALREHEWWGRARSRSSNGERLGPDRDSDDGSGEDVVGVPAFADEFGHCDDARVLFIA